MEGSLFNSGFLGSKFLWWSGQVADDRTWRDNQNPKKVEDPKDHKEHVNHGMIEYTEADLEMHNDAFHAHEENEENPGGAKINDWHTRHEDQHLEVYCDNHPDSFECRVYDD